MNLEGKVALVTGASKGIGKSIVEKLAVKGAKIAINYRNKTEELEVLQKDLEAKGTEVMLVKGDVSSFHEVKEIVNSIVDKFGRIDILVNNAGITKDSLLMRMKEEDFDKVIEINLKGAFNTIRHIAPIMIKQRSGRIINISSVIGLIGNAGQFNYAASKAGIIGATKSAAKELASRGITVNAVAPGFIQTDMTDVLSDKVKDTIMEHIPLKKLGTGNDVANTVAFLASEEASYITGQIINVDGGMVM